MADNQSSLNSFNQDPHLTVNTGRHGSRGLVAQDKTQAPQRGSRILKASQNSQSQKPTPPQTGKSTRLGNTAPLLPGAEATGGSAAAAGAGDKAPLDYAKAVALFEARNTRELWDRQLAVLRRVHRRNRDGFCYGDLAHVARLLELAAERAAAGAHPGFEEALRLLVEDCQRPLRRAKANEELMAHGLAAFRALAAALGALLGPGPGVGPGAAGAAGPGGRGTGGIGRHVRLEAALALRALAAGNERPGEGAPRDPRSFAVAGGQRVARDLRRPRRETNLAALRAAGVPAAAAAQLAAQVEELRGLTLDAARPPSGRRPLDPEADPALGSDDSSDDDGDFVGDMMGEIDESDGVSVDELVRGLLGLVHELSTDRETAAAVCEAGGLAPLLALLEGRARCPYVRPLAAMGAATLDVLVELLWNLLEHSRDRAAAALAPSRSELVRCQRRANALYLLANPWDLGVLTGLLEEMLRRGYRHKDKELRNEVLIVISFVAKHPNARAACREAGLLRLLLRYATYGEGGDYLDPEDPGADLLEAPRPANFATTLEVDLELKRLMWSLLADLCAADDAAENLAAAARSPLLEALLVYLDAGAAAGSALGGGGGGAPSAAAGLLPSGSSRGGGLGGIPERPVESDSRLSVASVVGRLSAAQLRALQNEALGTLLRLAPRAPERFRQLGGLLLCLRLVDPLGLGGSGIAGGGGGGDPFAATGGDGTLRSQLSGGGASRAPAGQGDDGAAAELARGAMSVLLAVVEPAEARAELARLGAVPALLARFADPAEEDGMRADAAAILGRLCAGAPAAAKPNQVEFRRLGGVEAAVAALRAYCTARARTVADRRRKNLPEGEPGEGDPLNPLPVHAADCLWNAVGGNKKSVSRLLGAGGVDALLDLLEVCPAAMRHQVAGLAADLARNPRAVPYLKAWRSDQDMASAAQLLLRFWEEEERRLGLARPGGVLQNLHRPLDSHAAAGGDNLGGAAAAAGAPGAERFRGFPGRGGASLASLGDGGGGGAPPGAFDSAFNNSSVTSGGAFSRLNDALRASASLGDGGGGGGGCGDDGGEGAPAATAAAAAVKPKAQGRQPEAAVHGLSGEDRRFLTAAAGALDLRPKVALVLQALGFDLREPGLTPAQKTTLLMARHHAAFREAGAWMDVCQELRREGVNPIAADRLLLDLRLGAAFDRALRVKRRQAAFKVQKKQVEAEREDQFLSGILLQRDQELHQEVIKRNALVPKSTLQKRKAEKAAMSHQVGQTPTRSHQDNEEGGPASSTTIPIADETKTEKMLAQSMVSNGEEEDNDSLALQAENGIETESAGLLENKIAVGYNKVPTIDSGEELNQDSGITPEGAVRIEDEFGSSSFTNNEGEEF